MIAFMFLGPGVAALGFIYFSIIDPKQLRSEEHDLRKTALGIVEEQGNPIPINPTTVEAIADIAYLAAAAAKTTGDNGK